jgi:hypothetical protein
MPETVQIKFYDVECGFFKHGEDDPEFGALPETLNELHQWVDGKALQDTQTSSAGDTDEMIPMYCFDMNHSSGTGDYFLTMFLKVPTTEGSVASVDPSDTVGDATMSANEIRPGEIPGYPVYFWFLPDENLLATVRVDTQSRNGRMQLNRYMLDFLKYFSSHGVQSSGATERDRNIIGYTDPDEDADDVQSYFTRFKSSLVAVDGPIDEIRRRRPHIRKVVRKLYIGNGQDPADTSVWPWRDQGDYEEPVKVRQEVTIKPTKDELEDMIEQFRRERTLSEDNEETDSWNDFGVVYEGTSQNVTYFSHILPKAEFELNINRSADGFVDLESLRRAVYAKRGDIMSAAMDP